MPRRPAASFTSSSLSVSSSSTSPSTSLSRSLNNVYIKGLPGNCSQDGLTEWATATVASPASAKTIKDYSNITSRTEGTYDESQVPCSGVGFVKFHNHQDALAFISVVQGEKGMQACLAKETMHGQMERASDPSSTNLYISHLPLHFTEQDILSLFPRPAYSIASIRLLKTGDQPGRRSREPNPQFKGAAFARFETREMAERAIAEYNGKHLVDHHGQNESDRGKKQTLQLRFADSETQKQLKKQERYGPSSSSSALQIRQPPHRLTIKTMSAIDEHRTETDEEGLKIDAYERPEYTQSQPSSSAETSPIMHLGPFPVSTFAPPPLPQPATTYVASSASTILPPIPYSTLPVPKVDGFNTSPPDTTFPSFSVPNPTIQQIWPFQPKQELYGDGIGASVPQNNITPYPPPFPQPRYPGIFPANSCSSNSFTSAIPQSLSPPAPASAEPIQSILSSAAAAAEKAAQAAAYLQQYLGSLGYTKDAFPNLPPLLGLHNATAPSKLPTAFRHMPAQNPSFSASSSSALQTIFPSLNNYPNYPPSDGNHLDTFRTGNSHQSLQVSSLDVESRRNAQLQKEIEALQIQQKNLIDQTRILQAKMSGQEEGRNDEIIQAGRSVSPSVALNAYRFGNSWQESAINEEYGVQIENEDTSPLSTPARTRSMTTHHISKSNMNTLLPPASALARRSSAFEARDSKMLQEQQQQASLVEKRRGSASMESYGTDRRTSIYIPPHARDRDISAYTTPASSARGSLSSDTQSTRRGSLGTAHSTPPSVSETSTAFFERSKSLSPEVPAAVSMPPPGLEHIVPKEKIILPFDKALRSFSTAGLETYASKAASAMTSTAHLPEDYGVDEEAQKKIDLVKDFFSRRGSQQVPLISSEPRTSPNLQTLVSGGTVKAATAVPKRTGITRRNSSFLKLKSSFDSVKELNEGSPSPLSKVWQVDPRLQADGSNLGEGGEAPGSGSSDLTQIRPHFTFGVSHASSSVESQLSAVGKPGAYARARPTNAMLDTLRAPKLGPGIEGERKNSDASEDVVEQFMHSKVEEGAPKESSTRN